MMGGAGPAGGRGRPSLRTAFAVFGNRNYRFLWLSSLASFTAMQMQMIAGSWLAWELSGSFAVVGLIALATGLPMLLLSLVGGAVADRANKRNLSALSQGVITIFALATAFLVFTDLISIPFLIGFGLLQGIAFAFGMPARQPLTIMVVGQAQMMSAMALGSASMNGTRLIGPAFAGLLIGWQGVGLAYAVQGAFSLLSIALLLVIPASLGAAAAPAPGMARGSIGQEIGKGLRYAAGHSTLRLLLLMAFIPALFAMPYQMLLAGFVEGDLDKGPGAFGMLQSVAGVGALAGSILVATLVEFPRKPLLQVLFGILAGIGLVLLGTTAIWWGFAAAVAAVFLLGLTLSCYQTLNMTMLMATADPVFYGRMMSIVMLTFSVMPLMAAPLGLAADRIGTTNLFVLQGVAVAGLLALVSLMNPRYTFGRASPASPAEQEATLPEESEAMAPAPKTP